MSRPPVDGQHTSIDPAWVARVREGDPAAFEAIFHAYYGSLCTFAEGLVGSPDVAEEVVSEVFLRIWIHRARWEVRENLKSYLYRATRNQALNHLAHEQVTRRVHSAAASEGRSPGMGQTAPLADLQLEDQQFAKNLRRAIDELPERTREAFLLQRQHGMTYAEIAEVMGVSVFTVKNHLVRAVKTLRNTLGDWLILTLSLLS